MFVVTLLLSDFTFLPVRYELRKSSQSRTLKWRSFLPEEVALHQSTYIYIQLLSVTSLVTLVLNDEKAFGLNKSHKNDFKIARRQVFSK